MLPVELPKINKLQATGNSLDKEEDWKNIIIDGKKYTRCSTDRHKFYSYHDSLGTTKSRKTSKNANISIFFRYVKYKVSKTFGIYKISKKHDKALPI